MESTCFTKEGYPVTFEEKKILNIIYCHFMRFQAPGMSKCVTPFSTNVWHHFKMCDTIFSTGKKKKTARKTYDVAPLRLRMCSKNMANKKEITWKTKTNKAAKCLSFIVLRSTCETV